jgi:hypothetical protein
MPNNKGISLWEIDLCYEGVHQALNDQSRCPPRCPDCIRVVARVEADLARALKLWEDQGGHCIQECRGCVTRCDRYDFMRGATEPLLEARRPS